MRQGESKRAPKDVWTEACARGPMSQFEQAIQDSKVAAVRHEDERKRAAMKPQHELELAA